MKLRFLIYWSYPGEASPMKLNIIVGEERMKVQCSSVKPKKREPQTVIKNPKTDNCSHCTQVTGWSYYLWVLDVYPVLAEEVRQMMKEDEEGEENENEEK